MALKTKQNKGPISDINITPFVDVVLVLLVIFMITAPLMLNGIQLELPKTKEVNRMNISSSQVILSFTRTHEIYLGKNRFLKSEIIGVIEKEFKDKKTNILYFRADYGVRYGNVARLVSFLKRAGIVNIALVTELEEKK